MRAADLCGPAIALAGAAVCAMALLTDQGRAAEPSPANRTPVEELDVWRLVACETPPPRRGQCGLVEGVAPLPLGDCQDLARGLQRILPPPAIAGCMVDALALAEERGL